MWIRFGEGYCGNSANGEFVGIGLHPQHHTSGIHAVRLHGMIVIIMVASYGCSPAPRYTAHPIGGGKGRSNEMGNSSAPLIQKPPVGTKFRGMASYYADKYNGKQTSSGEIYDMYGLTCAHNQLPFNTWLEVRNLSNDRTVIVRVNDRGPFVEGRLIDLSYSAAKELDMIGKGVQEVEITVIR